MKGGGEVVSMTALWVNERVRKTFKAGARVVVGKCFVKMPWKEWVNCEMDLSLIGLVEGVLRHCYLADRRVNVVRQMACTAATRSMPAGRSDCICLTVNGGLFHNTSSSCLTVSGP